MLDEPKALAAAGAVHDALGEVRAALAVHAPTARLSVAAAERTRSLL